eukprot:COSAG02_NODE_667_length_18713_cov_17.795262_15_plen_44_part_00
MIAHKAVPDMYVAITIASQTAGYHDTKDGTALCPSFLAVKCNH